MTLLCILTAILAFLAFGLSTDSHHKKRVGAAPTPKLRRDLRRIAWALVALCCALAFVAKGWIYGAVFWTGALSFGAAASFLLLNLTGPQKAP